MAGYRKLSRETSVRKALIRAQVTSLLEHGKIRTTEAKAKEIRKEVEHLIALAVKEKDNFEEVTVKAKVAKEYKAVAWLLESGIYSPNQSGATKDYHKIYDYALRNISGTYSKSNISGESIGVLAEGETYDCAFELDVVNTKWKYENMGVLVIVSAKDAQGRWEVANSAVCKINEAKEYEYIQ